MGTLMLLGSVLAAVVLPVSAGLFSFEMEG
jgi:hypothetical protein